MAFLIPAFGLSVAAAASARYLNKHHGPEVVSPKVGDKVKVEGQEKFVIGYFGASDQTVANLDLEHRPLYMGSLKVAQYYAQNRTAREGTPKTVMLVADSIPKEEHLDTARFSEGAHRPLSPQGLKDLNVKAVNPTEVNHKTQVGFLANLKRAFKKEK